MEETGRGRKTRAGQRAGSSELLLALYSFPSPFLRPLPVRCGGGGLRVVRTNVRQSQRRGGEGCV